MISTSGTLRLVCAAAEIEEQLIKRVTIQGISPIAVCRYKGRFYAFADTCSHGLASLSEGEIEDGQVYCPFHGGAFDIATGKPTERPCTIAIKTYPIVEQDGDLFIKLPE